VYSYVVCLLCACVSHLFWWCPVLLHDLQCTPECVHQQHHLAGTACGQTQGLNTRGLGGGGGEEGEGTNMSE